MNDKLRDRVMRAIEQARRTPGWNNRSAKVQRFELAHPGNTECCVLFVVPCKRWAYRRWERRLARDTQRSAGNTNERP